MLSISALEAILGIKEGTVLEPREMAKKLHVVFYEPIDCAPPSETVLSFQNELRNALSSLGVHIHDYDSMIITVPVQKTLKRFFAVLANNTSYLFKKIFNVTGPFDHFITYKTAKQILQRKKIKDGVTIFTYAPIPTEQLPINVVSSFKNSSIVSIIERPKHIHTSSPFKDHFDTAMSMFAEHMCNIVLLVDPSECTLYNFNASHPTFKRNAHLSKSILATLIPKIYAPIRPLRLKDLVVVKKAFNPSDSEFSAHVADFIQAGNVFSKTNLYPEGKSIASLPFRNDFHKWIGKLHLDHRTGMSYGFLAKQLPQKIPSISRLASKHASYIHSDKDYFWENGHLHVILLLDNQYYTLEIPEVRVLSLRSGSKKTAINTEHDFLLLSLKDGKVHMTPPRGLKVNSSYKPSFDTHVILAHAVGTVILSSILKHYGACETYIKNFEQHGQGIVHWHGYINKEILTDAWMVYGGSNPHVACSSPQSALFALDGKLKHLDTSKITEWELKNTLHIEPHHGSNAMFSTLTDASEFLSNAGINVSLGNQYLESYENPHD